MNSQIPPIQRRILIVDDSQALAQTEAWLLEAEGHVVRLSEGLDALPAAQKFRPDLVLLDIGMPQISGLEVCRLMRADPQVSTARIIAQTGWGDPAMQRRVQEAGFDDHLVKPVAFELLKAVVGAVPSLHPSVHQSA